MKIINDNKLHNGTFTASNESLNYPATNLDDPFLAKRFQATSSTSTIMVILSSASTIDSVGHGVTNATSGTIILYTGGPTTYTSVESVSVDLTYDPCITYTATAQSSVTKITIELSTGDTYLYLGGISAGEYYDLDYPDAEINRNHTDNSTWQQTAGGQSLANYQEPLRNTSLTFRPKTLAESNELIDVYRETGIGSPFFMEFFESQRDIYPPQYCCFSDPPDDTGAGQKRNITISLQECK